MFCCFVPPMCANLTQDSNKKYSEYFHVPIRRTLNTLLPNCMGHEEFICSIINKKWKKKTKIYFLSIIVRHSVYCLYSVFYVVVTYWYPLMDCFGLTY